MSIKVSENMRSKLDPLGDEEQQLLEKVQQGELVTRNINEEHCQRMTWGDRIADRVASTMGSSDSLSS